jgi:hypothetical protein
MKIIKKCILFYILLFVKEISAQQKLCQNSDSQIPIIVVQHPASSMTNSKINKMISSKELEIDQRASTFRESLLKADYLQLGDCVLLNKVEEDEFKVSIIEDYSPWHSFISKVDLKKSTFTKNLIPVVMLKKSDKSRTYGFIENSNLSSMTEMPHQELHEKELLKHKVPNDVIVVYVICDKDRNELCEVSLRKGEKWILHNKKRNTLSVLARSRRENRKDPSKSHRVLVNGDTPQGIYYLWASMYSDNPVFGNIHRIDLDGSQPPINSYAYEINKLILDMLIPAKAHNDYWLQEWALAYNLGRNSLRFHDNSLDPNKPDNFIPQNSEISFRSTDGCINTSRSMEKILTLLTQLGVFNTLDLELKDSPQSLNWKVTPHLGKVFVILKDKS